MIRQPLVQPIPDEPPDCDVHLRFAHQPAVMDEAQQKTRKHQPYRHFRIDSRTTSLRAIAIRHFLAQPAQFQYAVHTDQRRDPSVSTAPASRPRTIRVCSRLLRPNISCPFSWALNIIISNHRMRTFSTAP